MAETFQEETITYSAADRLDAYVPPHNIDAEQSVLGAILIDRDVMDRCSGLLSPKDFYRESHECLFEILLFLHSINRPIDSVTVASELRKRGKFDLVGGATYLIALLDAVPTTANVEHYAQIVKEKSTLRAMQDSCRKALDILRSPGVTVKDAVEHIEQITMVATPGKERDYTTIGQAALKAYELSEDAFDQGKTLTGIPTGIEELDLLTGGFPIGEVTVVVARPRVGKGAIMASASMHNAKNGTPAAVYSIEMGLMQNAYRYLAAETSIQVPRLQLAKFGDDGWNVYAKACSTFLDLPLYLFTGSDISVSKLQSDIRRIKREKDVRIAYIDYIQIMNVSSKFGNRNNDISAASQTIQNLAKELQVSIVVFSQAGRQVDRRDDKRPQLGDGLDSGGIEANASLVLGLYRESVYAQRKPGEPPPSPDKMEILVLKNRNGDGNGTAYANFRGEFFRYEPWQEQMSIDGGTGY